MCLTKVLALVASFTFVSQAGDSTSVEARGVSTENCPTPPEIVNGNLDCQFSDELLLVIFCIYACNTGYKFEHILDKDIYYLCDVSAGFFDKVEPDNCVPACDPPCLNGGYCTAPNNCTCKAPYYGDQCLHSCGVVCLNGGVCTGPNTCNCTPPYSGDHCQTFALVTGVSSTHCPLPAPLANGVIDCHYSNSSHNQILCQYNCTSGYMFEGTRAQTFDFSCDVSLGYYDPPLTPGCVPSCQPPCSNGGLCMHNNTCSCVPPYTGDRCLAQASIVG